MAAERGEDFADHRAWPVDGVPGAATGGGAGCDIPVMRTSMMLFTRDLRVRDNPALVAACRAERVVPVFVFDDALLGGPFAAPNRVRFLLDSLADLRESLR